MKRTFLILSLNVFIVSKAQQILPLSTVTTDVIAPNTYIKDIDNLLPAFEGTWKATWDNKTFIINFKKVKYYDTFSKNNPYYQDLLLGRFQVKDINGKILFDDLSSKKNTEKIMGMKIYPSGKYQLLYSDPDLCNKLGTIMIGFHNLTKTEMSLKYTDSKQPVDSSCFYYGLNEDRQPQPFPKEIVLTKQ